MTETDVVNAAREFLSRNGSFRASDGYTSYAVGDAEALRQALAELDGYETRPKDHPLQTDDPTEAPATPIRVRWGSATYEG